jgi:hypothetical protein
MAKSDILVRWKADTANYDANMAKAKRQLEQFGQQNMTAGGVVQQLTSKLVGAATKFAGFGAAASAAMKVVKDAFMSSERNIDAWESTVASAKSVYETFTHALNNGDFSGFLSRIDQVVAKAKEAYEALDELGTRMTIINPERQKLQTEQTRLKSIIRREGAGSAAGQAAQAQLKALEPRLMRSYQTEGQLNYNAFEAEVKRMLATENIKLGKQGMQTLMESFSSDALFQRIRQNARGTKELRILGSGDNQRTETIDRRNTNQKLMDLFTDEWRKQWSPLLNASFAAQNTAYSMMLGDARYVKSTGGATGGGKGGGKTTATEIKAVTGSIDEQAKKVEELRKAWRAAADDDSRQKIKKQIEEQEFALDIMMGKSSGIPTMNYGMGDLSGKGGSGLFQEQAFKVDNSPKSSWKLDEKAMAALGDYITRINTKTDAKVTEVLGGLNNGMQNVATGIEQLGFDIPDGLRQVFGGIQAVISILTGIATIVTAIQAVAAADAIIPFARGGVVHAANGYVTGNHYSGDLVPAMLNSGELVLNRAQQGNLASQLNDARGGAQLEAVITGEQLRLVLNNNGKRTGRGEVVTTKFR